MNVLCKIFWHRMYFDTHDVAGPSHCKRWRCDHTEPGLEWDRYLEKIHLIQRGITTKQKLPASGDSPLMNLNKFWK